MLEQLQKKLTPLSVCATQYNLQKP